MISLATAQAQLLALAHPRAAVTLPLSECYGRYLAQDVVAKRNQPMADLSAMDGYAIRFEDLPGPWQMIGESAAGRGFAGSVGAGQAVRIFTGATVPDGADTILIQEDAASDGDIVHLTGEGPLPNSAHIRLKSNDFSKGQTVSTAGERLSAGKLALAAMAGYGSLCVFDMPKVAYFSTGDELVASGVETGPDQLPSSNTIMIAGLLADSPCQFEDFGIVPDKIEAIVDVFQRCVASGAEIIVTSGGVSVGDHDLIQTALRAAGARIEFWKIAMKPGKPVLVARLADTIVLGLPGNPSSAYVTAFLLLLPLVAHFNGACEVLPAKFTARLTQSMPETGERAEFIRGFYQGSQIEAFDKQDSGLVSVLARANALIIRSEYAQALAAGDTVEAYHL
jgi:molybdopterin molybdotransferase